MPRVPGFFILLTVGCAGQPVSESASPGDERTADPDTRASKTIHPGSREATASRTEPERLEFVPRRSKTIHPRARDESRGVD